MNYIKKIAFEKLIPFIGGFFKAKNKYINVIYYHDIVNGEGYGSQKTNLELFKRQMCYIRNNGYKTFTFAELDDNIVYDKKSVLITFDDGWLSNYTAIFEYMKSMEIKYNIYLEVGKIGNDDRYLSWDMVKEMANSGVVGFGAHTFSHPDLSDLSVVDVQQEFFKANEIIREQLGVVPKDFCYPFGKWSKDTNDYLIQNTPYTRIYTSDMKYSYDREKKIIFGRNSINGDRSFKVFVNMLKGNYNIYNLLRGKADE